MAGRGLTEFSELHRWSATKRAEFWGVMIERLGIHFNINPDQILDDSAGVEQVQWLPGAEYNIVDSCFRAPSKKVAIRYRENDIALTQEVTYGDLEEMTNRVANGLREAEFNPGDRLGIYMPMNIESVAIYLGIIKAGCVAVSLADSFAAPELGKRLKLAEAKGIFTVDHYMRNGKLIGLFENVRDVFAPKAIVTRTGAGSEGDRVLLRQRDIEWANFLSEDDSFASITGNPNTLTNILFSSGTTGDPKMIPWGQTSPIGAATDFHLHQDVKPSSVVAWPTNLGWVMGPILIYGSLLNKATMALYGDAPTTEGFGKFVRDAKISMLGLVPSMVAAWRKLGCMERLDWSAIETFSSTGESSSADDYAYLMALAKNKPVIEYCGGTEIGGGYLLNTVVEPTHPSICTTARLGLDFVILDEDHQEVPIGGEGELYLISPWLGESQELLNGDHHDVYYANCPTGPQGEVLRRHGDWVRRLENGYQVLGRADDTMNLSGIKTSSADLEGALIDHEGVSEIAAIAVRPESGGTSQLVIYVVASGEGDSDGLQGSLQTKLKTELNPAFRIRDVVLVGELPRTATGKVKRKELRTLYTSN